MNAARTTGPTPAKERLCVGHVVLSLQVGGLERVVVDLINHASVSCVVVCLDEAGELAAEVEGTSMAIVALERRPGFRPWLALGVRRVIRRLGVDVVHTHNTAAGFYGAIAGRLSRRPVVHTKHGANLASTGHQGLLNRVALRMSDRIVAVSEASRSLALSEGADPRRTTIIDNGIDVDRFVTSTDARAKARERLKLPPEAFVVGTVARLAPEKNQALLLDAFSAVAGAASERAPAHLVLIGDGPEREALRQRAHAAAAPERVVFVGAYHHVEDLLPALDVFALPSDSEGLPVALLEAMAAAIPPVVTRVGAMPAVVDHGRSGIVVEPGRREELACALESLRADGELRDRLARAARERVAERYRASLMAQAYEAIYRELAPRGTSA